MYHSIGRLYLRLQRTDFVNDIIKLYRFVTARRSAWCPYKNRGIGDKKSKIEKATILKLEDWKITSTWPLKNLHTQSKFSIPFTLTSSQSLYCTTGTLYIIVHGRISGAMSGSYQTSFVIVLYIYIIYFIDTCNVF